MNLLGGIRHFFSMLFGADGDIAHKVLSDVSQVVIAAKPIVLEIETELKPLPQAGLVDGIAKFIAKYEPNLEKAVTLAQSLSTLSGGDLWRKLASLALGAMLPKTEASAINLAIEMAYSFLEAETAKA